MRTDLVELLQSREELRQFIREQPQWYRRLSRNPGEQDAFELAALQYYKKTIPDQVAKIQNQISVAALMLEMFQYMRQQNAAPVEQIPSSTEQAQPSLQQESSQQQVSQQQSSQQAKEDASQST